MEEIAYKAYSGPNLHQRPDPIGTGKERIRALRFDKDIVETRPLK
jgi:hypothetical protein